MSKELRTYRGHAAMTDRTLAALDSRSSRSPYRELLESESLGKMIY